MTHPSTDPKRADASALLALARAHPKMTPDHLKRAFRRGAPKVKRDWLLVPDRKPVVPDTLPEKMPKPKRIITMVAAAMDVPVDEIYRVRRHAKVCDARHVCMWLIRKHCTRASYPTIGMWMQRDHTSVIHGVRKVDANFEHYAPIIEAVERAL